MKHVPDFSKSQRSVFPIFLPFSLLLAGACGPMPQHLNAFGGANGDGNNVPIAEERASAIAIQQPPSNGDINLVCVINGDIQNSVGGGTWAGGGQSPDASGDRVVIVDANGRFLGYGSVPPEGRPSAAPTQSASATHQSFALHREQASGSDQAPQPGEQNGSYPSYPGFSNNQGNQTINVGGHMISCVNFIVNTNENGIGNPSAPDWAYPVPVQPIDDGCENKDGDSENKPIPEDEDKVPPKVDGKPLWDDVEHPPETEPDKKCPSDPVEEETQPVIPDDGESGAW